MQEPLLLRGVLERPPSSLGNDRQPVWASWKQNMADLQKVCLEKNIPNTQSPLEGLA